MLNGISSMFKTIFKNIILGKVEVANIDLRAEVAQVVYSFCVINTRDQVIKNY